MITDSDTAKPEPTHEMVVSTIGGDEFCIPVSRKDWSTEQVARDVAIRCKGDAAALYGMTEPDSPHGQVGAVIPVHAILTVLVRDRRRPDTPETAEQSAEQSAEQPPAEQVPIQADANSADADAAADAAADPAQPVTAR